MRKKIDESIEEIYNTRFCKRCRGLLTDEDINRAKKERFLPLCPKCYDIMKETLKKCIPLFIKLKKSL